MDRYGRTRSEQRDDQRTSRIMGAALRGAGGDRTTAAARLRLQAGDALASGRDALHGGDGDDRARQSIEQSTRLLRAAELIDLGQDSAHPAASLKRTRPNATERPRPSFPRPGVHSPAAASLKRTRPNATERPRPSFPRPGVHSPAAASLKR